MDGYEGYTPEQIARAMQADAEQILMWRRCLTSPEGCGTCGKLCPRREPVCPKS